MHPVYILRCNVQSYRVKNGEHSLSYWQLGCKERVLDSLAIALLGTILQGTMEGQLLMIRKPAPPPPPLDDIRRPQFPHRPRLQAEEEAISSLRVGPFACLTALSKHSQKLEVQAGSAVSRLSTFNFMLYSLGLKHFPHMRFLEFL